MGVTQEGSPLKSVRVYDAYKKKWLAIQDGEVIYVTDNVQGTTFTVTDLASANEWFEAFYLYKNHIYAVPVGSNLPPTECDSVSVYLREMRKRREQEKV